MTWLRHGHARTESGPTRLYRIWAGMKTRCTNPNYKQWKDYGGRGITIDAEWLSFDKFLEDMGASYELHVSLFGEKDTTLDRIKNDERYCKKNCRWATAAEQARSNRGVLTSDRTRGEKNSKTRLTVSDVRNIRNLGKTMEQKDIGAMYGMYQGSISKIIRRTTWRHVS